MQDDAVEEPAHPQPQQNAGGSREVLASGIDHRVLLMAVQGYVQRAAALRDMLAVA
jgi:hypothetical protein